MKKNYCIEHHKVKCAFCDKDIVLFKIEGHIREHYNNEDREICLKCENFYCFKEIKKHEE